MAHIEAKGLVKHYGDVKAVLGVDFEVADGEFVAILGPSGCGKSSTMRMIAGLEEITDGTISFDGKVVNDVRARDRNVAMSFENYALYAPLTIYENIAFPLRSVGKSDAQVDKRVREIAEKMELTDMLHLKPGGLSSGQAQRVGLARALVRNPSVFLLDEPISHLDTRQRYRMRRFIKSLHLEFGYTMIYVTHDQEEALALADRVMVMSDGEIQQMDIPETIYQKPKNKFVAGFVGEPPINFLPFETIGDGMIRIQNNKVSLPSELVAKLDTIGTEGLLGIRPHFMSLGNESPVVLQGTAFVTDELQDHNEIFIDIGELKISLITLAHQRVERGEPVSVSLDPKHVLLFPNDD